MTLKRKHHKSYLPFSKKFQFQTTHTEQECVYWLQKLPPVSLTQQNTGKYAYRVDINTNVHPFRFRVAKVFLKNGHPDSEVACVEGEIYEEMGLGVTQVRGELHPNTVVSLVFVAVITSIVWIVLKLIAPTFPLWFIAIWIVLGLLSIVGDMVERNDFLKFFKEYLQQDVQP
jgi:hypothetical protein